MIFNRNGDPPHDDAKDKGRGVTVGYRADGFELCYAESPTQAASHSSALLLRDHKILEEDISSLDLNWIQSSRYDPNPALRTLGDYASAWIADPGASVTRTRFCPGGFIEC